MTVIARQSIAYQNEHLDQDHSKSLNAFEFAVVFISAACMLMRVCSRKLRKWNLGRDDWTFLAGSALAQGEFITQLIYSFDAGLGRHWVTLTPEEKALFPKLNYAFNILNLACYPIIKISILLLYLRIFTNHKHFRLLCWIGVTFLSAMCISNTLVAMFACTPVRSFWDASVPGKCIDVVPFYWATAIMNVLTDVYILLLPMPMVWGLKIRTRRKISISIIFILGGLTFVISILRIIFYFDYTVTDPSYSFLRSGYATPGEVCLAIVVACAPTWLPIWVYVSSFTKSVFRRMSSTDSSSGPRFDLVASHSQARSATLADSDDDETDDEKAQRRQLEVSRKSSVTYVEEIANSGGGYADKSSPSSIMPTDSGSQTSLNPDAITRVV